MFLQADRSLFLMPSRSELGELPAAVTAWQLSVKARGGVATRMPANRDPAHAGQLAARFGGEGSATPNAVPRYELAPAAVQRADGAIASDYASSIAAGARVQAVEDAAKSLAKGALELPRNVVGGVLGIPPGLVGVLVAGGAAFAAWRLLGGIAPIARTNPPRRRRRRRTHRRSSRR
jgi:hypothetical protein